MADNAKRVILRDPVTGDKLIPVSEMNGGDADTLHGQTANDIINQAVSQVTAMVSSKLDAVVQVTYNGGEG